MRPIVSAVGSPGYRLARELAQILTPLAGPNGYTVKNFVSFVETVKELQISPQDLLVSFDVTNLFTQVPIMEALRVIEEKLAGDQSLESRTNIPVPHLVELVEFSLRSSYLQFQDSFYEQIDGAAMGSPLLAIIANLYLEHLKGAIRSAPLQPKLLHRYVDDTFVLWPRGQNGPHHFHQHLNRQYPSFQFIMEEEKDHKIALLDVLVTRNDDRLATSVYRKPTHTKGTYVPFHSNHQPKTITGVMRGMRDRAHRVYNPPTNQKSYNISMRFSRQMVFPPTW